jgi:hypothetical protein
MMVMVMVMVMVMWFGLQTRELLLYFTSFTVADYCRQEGGRGHSKVHDEQCAVAGP